MRQEFKGVGKEGMTEVRVNAMAARGRREGIPVCRFSSRVLVPSPLSLLVEMPATNFTIQGCQPANFSSTWCNYKLFRKRAV